MGQTCGVVRKGNIVEHFGNCGSGLHCVGKSKTKYGKCVKKILQGKVIFVTLTLFYILLNHRSGEYFNSTILSI